MEQREIQSSRESGGNTMLKGDKIVVIKAITDRANGEPDIPEGATGTVTTGKEGEPTVTIDFGGAIGDIYFPQGSEKVQITERA